MASRKKQTSKVEEVIKPIIEPKTEVKNRPGKVLKNTVIRSGPSKDSPLVPGAVMAGEMVTIIGEENPTIGWVKICKNIINITGYINSDCIT